MSNKRLPWEIRITIESNHNVVPAPANEDHVWEFCPGRNHVEVREIGNPFPKVAFTVNLGPEVGTPLA